MVSIYNVTAEGSDLDSFGHVNNSVYLRYIENARWNFFKDQGFLDRILDAGIFFVVLETKIRYVNEIKIFDEIEIKTEWSCSGEIVINQHRLTDRKTGKLFAKATCRLAFITNERLICDIPEVVKKEIEGA